MLKDSYKIVRLIDGLKPRVILKQLTLEEARLWCSNPKSSSACAGAPRRDGRYWFDGYEKEEGVSLVR